MIGVFDSGSGGLTVLKAIREELPSCDVVYFGDIANVPYGDKTPEQLLGLVVGGIGTLTGEGATKIVCACNSVSASMAMSLLDATGLKSVDTIEMVGPTVSYLRDMPYRIALCATPATIRSGIYQSAFKLVGKDILTIPVPDLAPAIEFGSPSDEVEQIIRGAFAAVDLSQYDVLILACTHYPLVIDEFKKVVPPTMQLFDPAVAVAERVYKQFWPQEVGEGTTRFLISRESPNFRALVERLFPGQQFTIETVA